MAAAALSRSMAVAAPPPASDMWPEDPIPERLVPLEAWSVLDADSGGGAPFANHDCVGLTNPILDWDRLRRGLRPECEHTRETRTLECAATIRGWEDHVLPFLHLHQRVSADELLEFEAFDRIEATAKAQCPLGVLILNIARILLCLRGGHAACYLKHNPRLSRDLYDTPLLVVMGTDWPIYALLNSYDWSWPGIPGGRDYACSRSNRTVIDWPSLRRALHYDPSLPMTSWWKESVRYVFSPTLVRDFYTGSFECLYGVYVLNMVKAMWATDTESSSYKIYAPYVQWILFESVHLLGASGWQIFALLHHFTSLRRHGFRLDLTAAELGGLPFREHGEWLQALPLQRHVGLASSYGAWRPPLAAAARAFLSAIERADPGFRFAYVTMVYGRFNRYIAGWSARLRRLAVGNLVMATLDDEAYALCVQHHIQEQCVRGSISVLNKYTFLLVALQLGVDVMWLDFDVFLVRDPGPALRAAAEGYDLLMGYDYDSDCLCNGFFYLRARPVTHTWLFTLLRWLYDHPYEHDQRAIAAFLNYTEKIAARPEELPPIPKWYVFDVDNRFINWGSWEGRFERLQLIHFVDGSAFSLYGRQSWDPSIPAEKAQLEEGGHGVPADGGGDGHEAEVAEGDATGSVPSAMAAFYRPAAVAADPERFWAEVPQLRRLAEAKRRPRPQQRQRCGILPDVETAHVGYGWVNDAEDRRRRLDDAATGGVGGETLGGDGRELGGGRDAAR